MRYLTLHFSWWTLFWFLFPFMVLGGMFVIGCIAALHAADKASRDEWSDWWD